MKFSYDYKADAMYIELTGYPSTHTKKINFNFLLHLSQDDQVTGIEILNVRKSAIDPLTLITEYLTPDQPTEHPDSEAIKARRAELAGANPQKHGT